MGVNVLQFNVGSGRKKDRSVVRKIRQLVCKENLEVDVTDCHRPTVTQNGFLSLNHTWLDSFFTF